MSEQAPTYEASSPPLPSLKRAFVAVLEGADSGAVPLTSVSPVTVGRSRSCSIQVDDGSVSRLQATISWDGAHTVLVEDHGSKNGTFVGSTRVEGKTRLPAEATIQVGPARLAVVLPKAQDEPVSATRAVRGFVAEDAAMEAVVQVLARAARKNATVLLLGETGSGKEVMARWVHDESPRAKGPFVALNCGSLPETLAESTLFGHERGAFTGAVSRHLGAFEQANGGTLFLDEIGELSATSQTRLLRVLEEHRVTRLGATSSVPVDVRVVAATHRNLDSAVAEGRFRGDLLARLREVPMHIPALRHRREDLVLLVRHFLTRAGRPEATPTLAYMLALAHYDFPYNVRELESAVKLSVALADGKELDLKHLPTTVQAALEGHGARAGAVPERAVDGSRPVPMPMPSPNATVDRTRGQRSLPTPPPDDPDSFTERFGPVTPSETALRELLGRHRGNIAAVARELGKERMQIHRWLKRYDIDVEDYRV